MIDSPAKRLASDTGRRGGKTHALAVGMLDAAAVHRGSTCPVFERTTTCQAARVLWKHFKTIDKEYKLGCEFNNTNKIVVLPNRSEIPILGADTLEAADKGRGDKYPRVGIDEAGTFRPSILEYLLDEVIVPATLDYDGSIWMIGTPDPRAEGPFFDACHDEHWEQHHWTMLDNPTIPDVSVSEGMTEEERYLWRVQWLEELKTRKGWTEDHPKLNREWYGRWVRNNDELVYRYLAERNGIDTLPERRRWYYVLGIDLGYNDPTAFVVLAYNDEDPTVYIIESYEEPRLIPSAVAAHVERLSQRYQFVSIVADTGGYGKGPAEEMKRRFRLPIKAAKKKDKAAHIEFMNGDYLSGRIQIVTKNNKDLCVDYSRLPWNDDCTKEHPSYANHLPDAALYGYRECMTLVEGLGLREAPKVGSEAWRAAREHEMVEALERKWGAKGTAYQGDEEELYLGEGNTWAD